METQANIPIPIAHPMRCPTNVVPTSSGEGGGSGGA